MGKVFGSWLFLMDRLEMCMRLQGCDGSVLLDGKGTEKAAPSNARLEGFQAMDAMKAAVERACPGAVSCADILAFAARDAVVISDGPDWEVPAGRRDGKISVADEAEANLPGPQMSIDELVQNFARQGLSKSDMVVLSGNTHICYIPFPG